MSADQIEMRSRAQLLGEIEDLRTRLDEAEQTLQAIRSGEVDALLVEGPQGEQVFSLTGVERLPGHRRNDERGGIYGVAAG